MQGNFPKQNSCSNPCFSGVMLDSGREWSSKPNMESSRRAMFHEDVEDPLRHSISRGFDWHLWHSSSTSWHRLGERMNKWERVFVQNSYPELVLLKCLTYILIFISWYIICLVPFLGQHNSQSFSSSTVLNTLQRSSLKVSWLVSLEAHIWNHLLTTSLARGHHVCSKSRANFPLVVASLSSFGCVGDMSKSTRCRRLGGSSLRVASCQWKLKKTCLQSEIHQTKMNVRVLSISESDIFVTPYHHWHPKSDCLDFRCEVGGSTKVGITSSLFSTILPYTFHQIIESLDIICPSPLPPSHNVWLPCPSFVLRSITAPNKRWSSLRRWLRFPELELGAYRWANSDGLQMSNKASRRG